MEKIWCQEKTTGPDKIQMKIIKLLDFTPSEITLRIRKMIHGADLGTKRRQWRVGERSRFGFKLRKSSRSRLKENKVGSLSRSRNTWTSVSVTEETHSQLFSMSTYLIIHTTKKFSSSGTCCRWNYFNNFNTSNQTESNMEFHRDRSWSPRFWANFLQL